MQDMFKHMSCPGQNSFSLVFPVFRVFACVAACMLVSVCKRVHVYVDKFISAGEKDKSVFIVERGANLNLSSKKVSAVHISSVPQLNKGKFELIWHFGLFQFRISSSSFGIPRDLNLSGWDFVCFDLFDFVKTVIAKDNRPY